MEIRSLPICLWNRDHLEAPLRTASLKTVKKKLNVSLLLFCSGFWLPGGLVELPCKDTFSLETGAPPLPHHFFLTPSSTTLCPAAARGNREGLYWDFSSSSKSSLIRVKFNHPVHAGGHWKIPGEETSISCCFSVSLPSSKAYRGSSSTFSSPVSKS